MDKDCIPITHKVFPGSVRDISTLVESAQRLKSEFDIDSPIIKEGNDLQEESYEVKGSPVSL